MTTAALWGTVLGVVLLAAVTWGVLSAYGVPHRWAPGLAILRGAVQLAAISVILSGAITSPTFVAVALLVMFSVAGITAARRLGWNWRNLRRLGASMSLGVGVSMGIIFASGAIELTPRYALAIGGIVVGNSMTTAVLAGRRFTEAINDHWEEVEGWLALGATPRQATLDLARGAVYSASIPSIDQTKTTGLVTLPGAFVGAIFGGISPLEAGRFQIVVLAGIMATGAITAVSVVASRANVLTRPAPLD
ncbi:ABC transporter permease [Paenarthrobacter sp. GOM3]|uniref:ABC transporter permease n=1 Tax=Paenarthrobacter sp. GOM3 TaxID=2782567 RepID=UPI001BACFDC1|nr:ABC transporter permease [Paenarthrobacter sp. GOM3]WOH20587.1 ABC transporter permease [Paenarthrobacter sp. GOM3]